MIRIGLTNGRKELSRIVHLQHHPQIQTVRDEIRKILYGTNNLNKEQKISALVEVLQSLLQDE